MKDQFMCRNINRMSHKLGMTGIHVNDGGPVSFRSEMSKQRGIHSDHSDVRLKIVKTGRGRPIEQTKYIRIF